MNNGRFLNQSQAAKEFFPELTRGGVRVLTALGILPGKRVCGWYLYAESDLIEVREKLDKGLEALRNQQAEVVA